MAKKLKTYETSLGFFDLAIAAPSMKAALEAWGADSNLFHQGAAKESADPDVVAATMAKPGVMLKRPVGSNGPFREHAELPTNLGDATARSSKAARKPAARKPAARKPKKTSSRPVDKAAEQKAAVAYEQEQKRRDRTRAKEEAARKKEREHRQQAVDKAQSTFDKAEREHAEKAGAIQAEAGRYREESASRKCPLEKGEGAIGCGAEARTTLELLGADAAAHSWPAIRSYSERIRSSP
jgi:hypothetical protein